MFASGDGLRKTVAEKGPDGRMVTGPILPTTEIEIGDILISSVQGECDGHNGEVGGTRSQTW